MTYETPEALRMALEQRLGNQSDESGVGIDRLRRRVIFERIVARLQVTHPGCWVLKGGMAIEVRLRDDARLTKDIDLGLRHEVTDQEDLQERLAEALDADPFGDGFVLVAGAVVPLAADQVGHGTWRSKVAAHLGGRPFGGIHLDISPRPLELDQTDALPLPNSLAFAGIDAPVIEVIDVHRHAAEKFHGMLKDFGERPNSRVRDLIDLLIFCEHQMLDPKKLAVAVEQVWEERDGVPPPADLPPLPDGWLFRYEGIAADQHLATTSLPAALAVVTALWAAMFPTEET